MPKNYIQLDLFGEWREIPNYEGLYEINYATNEVRSVERIVTYKDGRKRHVKEKILKTYHSKRLNYEWLTVGLSKNGVSKTWEVHALVAQTYPEICGEWFEGAVCDHLDRDATHNNPFNIRVGTQKDNMNNPLTKKAMREERQKRANYKGLSKKVYQHTKDTHELVKEWESVNEVEKQTGWHHRHIKNCCLGYQKTAYGFIWSYTPLTACEKSY